MYGSSGVLTPRSGGKYLSLTDLKQILQEWGVHRKTAGCSHKLHSDFLISSSQAAAESVHYDLWPAACALAFSLYMSDPQP